MFYKIYARLWTTTAARRARLHLCYLVNLLIVGLIQISRSKWLKLNIKCTGKLSQNKMAARENCTKCAKTVEQEDDAMECNLCKLWTHRTCAGKEYTASVYKALQKVEETRWYCKGKCGTDADNVMQLLNAFSKRLEVLEDHNANLGVRVLANETSIQNIEPGMKSIMIVDQEDDDNVVTLSQMARTDDALDQVRIEGKLFDKLKSCVEEAEQLKKDLIIMKTGAESNENHVEGAEIAQINDFKEQVDEVKKLKEEYAEIVKKGNTQVNPPTNRNPVKPIQLIVAEEIQEQNEREAKKNNLIITNMPEVVPISDADEQRLIDLELTGMNDEEMVDALWTNIKVASTSLKIKTIKRLPERIESRRDDKKDKPRPILIEFENSESKWKVLENAKNLQWLPQWKNNVWIDRDRTRAEQAREYELRVERRRREDAGEKGLIIKNGQIVQKWTSPLGFRQRRPMEWE